MEAVDPVIFFFLLGLAGGLAKSDLDIPDQINNAISIYLLLAIGLKGGIKLHGADLHPVLLPALGTLALGLVIPVTPMPHCAGWAASPAWTPRPSRPITAPPVSSPLPWPSTSSPARAWRMSRSWSCCW